MERTSKVYQDYLKILDEELILAMGCTEPISIAYGASYARDLLGGLPESLDIEVSGNLIKNVKSVVVPNTNGMRGIPAAAAAGAVAGRTDKVLEVISEVSPAQKEQIQQFIATVPITVTLKKTPLTFDYLVTAKRGDDIAQVRIANFHTNIVYARRNGEVLIDRPVEGSKEVELTDRSVLNLADILDFASTADVDDLAQRLDKQISFNSAISQEGLRNGYGAQVGKILLASDPDNLSVRVRAAAAAGSDARMNGCEMPVVIVSGSGNQGITASVPVIEYAHAQSATHEQLLRALAVSDLVTIHEKTGIGRLSAYCGAVSAGAGAAAGICYLQGGNYELISKTIINALAVSSGIVCDGAKSSCAGKIALSVESGLTGYRMALQNQVYQPGDGIVADTFEESIQNIGQLAHEGMKETDQVILHIMTDENTSE